MCQHYIKLKTKSPSGTRYAYVPCGECADCRRKQQSDWQFRLNAEFLTLKSKGWHVAFMTLTYGERELPRIPKELFVNEKEYRSIRCFSRTDVQDWIQSIRQYCKYHHQFKGENAVRYFVASEFGSETHRPHYHAILAWPPSVSYEEMHALCTHYWSHGYLFPRDPRGDKDMLSFEIVGDASKAFRYVSKYVCKDLDFKEAIRGVELKVNTRLFKDCCSFHLQSKGLGYSYVKTMDDDAKLQAYMNGVNFQGDGFNYKLPLYLKNKIVFDNDYVVTSSGRRLVRRKANEFFDKHKDEIFRKKAKYYEKLIRGSVRCDWFVKRGVSPEQASQFEYAIENYAQRLSAAFGFDVAGSCHIGEYYLAYFGVPYDRCKAIHTFSDALSQWYRRYLADDGNVPRETLMPHACWQALQDYFSLVLGCNTYCNLLAEQAHAEEDALSARILDYFNNYLAPKL